MRVRAVLLAGLATLSSAATAQAATFTVTTTGDTAKPAGCTAAACTLRSAISAAATNGNTADDVIVVPAGTYTLNAQLGGLVIRAWATRITLRGAGANTTIVQPPADTAMRVLSVGASASIAVEGVTLRNGNVTSGVGGNLWVKSQASATLVGVRVSNGRAPQGGGIAAVGATALTVTRSLIDGNSATGPSRTDLGGGVYVQGQTSAAAVTITDSTITANSARNGGGLGIVNNVGRAPALRGVTLARNSARMGMGGPGVGGIFSQHTNARFQGTIVAANTSTLSGGPVSVTVPANCSFPFAATDEGGNLETQADCGLAGNQNTDPRLGAALDTSNPPVLAIPANSPAVDIAACGARALDQRGLFRPQGALCDAGAYEVDQAATMEIDTGPSATVATGDVEFTFNASEPGVSPVCRLTGPGQSGTFVACHKADAQPYTGLVNGAYTFSVRDGGFANAPVASRSFTVAAVDTTITGGPSGLTNDPTPTFSFTGPGPVASFECRVDAAAFAACTSPHTTASLDQGAHTFEVRALTAAGAPDPSPASRPFTVDSIAPASSIDSGPAGAVSSTTAAFTFTSNEAGATFQCALDGAHFGACPVNYSGLSQGTHTFQVRAVDAATNIGTPASRTWTVDTIPPDTTLTGGPDGPINDTTLTFTFASDEANATFACSLDGAAFATCESPFTPPALGEGEHTFAVRARDGAGNEDATPATRAFTIDLTPPPAPQIVSGPAGPTAESSPAFAFAASDTITCRLDGPGTAIGQFGACASPKGFAGLALGDYVFIVRSVDTAGNANETRRAFTVTAPQGAQPTPTVSPTPTPTPSPSPTPAPTAQTLVAAPVAGTVLVRVPGAPTSSPLDTSRGIPFGSEVDAREGKVRLTALLTAGKPPESADFHDGLFTIHKVGGFVELRLSEKLTGCPKGERRTAGAAQKQPKSRRLWGDGKGKFRTRGEYSSATVRGTKWLVRDGCTTTLTRVRQGVVAVRDFVKHKTVLVKKGKRYTARAKRR